jgi:two-component system response regulator NreC
MEADQPIRIVLCDDHRIIIEGLQRLLHEAPGMACVGTAATGQELLFLLGHVRCDIILLDLDMPGMDGAEAMQRVKQEWPHTKVIILTMHDEDAVVRHLLESGADGYLLKTCGRDEMLRAIQAVHNGDKHFSARITESLLDQRRKVVREDVRLKDLTSRELDVLKALAEGLSNKEIGDRLFISARTVDTHRSNIMRKLDVHNVAALVRLAVATGLTR